MHVERLVERHLYAHTLQERDRGRDVPQLRYVANGQRLRGQQRAGENRQSRVLGAGGRHGPRQRYATPNQELVHDG